MAQVFAPRAAYDVLTAPARTMLYLGAPVMMPAPLRAAAALAPFPYASAVVVAALATACGGHTAAAQPDVDVQALAENGSDTSAAESDVETLATSFLSASRAGVATTSLGTGAYYVPAGCATSTRDDVARTATITFTDCSGPLGLSHVSGTIDVRWTVTTTADGETVHLDMTGSGMKANKATFDWSASGDVSTSGATRTMKWTATLDGETARGRPFTRHNAKDITWTLGDPCLKFDGSSDGKVGGRDVHTDVRSYARCRGGCPDAGSEITITDVKSGKAIDITFDGGRTATFTAASGQKTRITLACGL